MDSIYFEKQEGQLCAQHAINMLLQDHIFTAVDLSMIAQTLDTIEKEQLSDSSNYVSQHMDDTGYFSLQVIEMALKNVSNLRLINFESPEVSNIKVDPTLANAFVLHLEQHWFAIRKFGNQFVVLNSLNNGPVVITDTYLSLFLSQMVLENYHIFIVEGILPHCEADDVAKFCSFPLSNNDNVPIRPNSSSDIDSDEELQKAIAASEEQFQIDILKREDEEIKKALEESQMIANNSTFNSNLDTPNNDKNDNN
uniref:ubiquitinyl hydrolase 1 n=1 Tax=Strongyloides stercoralis TaxID=6248 RepID=A0A0K0E9U3_STRER